MNLCTPPLGCGLWIVDCQTTGDFVAWFMLMKRRHDDYELGYVVRKKYWNQGYGSEISRALIQFGFENGLQKIIAVTRKENIGSSILLEKVGFQFDKMVKVDGEEVELKKYFLTK